MTPQTNELREEFSCDCAYCIYTRAHQDNEKLEIELAQTKESFGRLVICLVDSLGTQLTLKSLAELLRKSEIQK